MRDKLPEIEGLGATAVVIGNGSAEQGAEFEREFASGLRILVDPAVRAYAAAGFARGLRATLGHRGLVHLWRAWRAGHHRVA